MGRCDHLRSYPMVIAVIVAINEKLPAAILIGAIMSFLVWLAYLKD